MRIDFLLARRRVRETGLGTEEISGWEISIGTILGGKMRVIPDSSPTRTLRNLEEAQVLIDLLSEYNMDLALPPAIPTILNSRGARTRPDNVFISEDISDWVTICDTLPDHTPPKADHFPIITHISFLTTTTTKERPWNFKATDWDHFKEALADRLENVPVNEQLQDKAHIDAALHQVETAILDTMAKTVPKSNPTPYAKRWWTKDLDKARKPARGTASVSRRFKQFPHHSSHEKARRARNDYNALIDKLKRQHWENWLENISDKTLGTVKYSDSKWIHHAIQNTI